MKKIFAFATALLMLASLAACTAGGSEDADYSFADGDQYDERPLVDRRRHALYLVRQHLHVRLGNRHEQADDEGDCEEERQAALCGEGGTAPFPDGRDAQVHSCQQQGEPDDDQDAAEDEADGQPCPEGSEGQGEDGDDCDNG